MTIETGIPKGGTSARESERATVLSASGIVKSFRRGVWPHRQTLPVLNGADLELCPGEIVGLAGENGSGKSTLMKILVGALRRDGGTLTRSGTLGYCPQQPVLYERLTCDEHFELFGKAYGLTPPTIDAVRAEHYDTFGYGRWANARVEELSGGTRAKLNLGLAMMHAPDLLLLDEPYAGFDWETYLRFWDTTAERRAAGRTLLIVSHFIADEQRFDRIVDLRDGKAIER